MEGTPRPYSATESCSRGSVADSVLAATAAARTGACVAATAIDGARIPWRTNPLRSGASYPWAENRVAAIPSMLAATWLKKVGTTDAARIPWTRIAPISWLTCSSAASFFVSFVASIPASPSKNAPVKTREKECGSELIDVAGAVVGRVSMPELVAHDVGTLPRKDRPSRGRTMEELQALAVVKGVEVDPEVEIHGQYGAHFPRYPRQQCPPEVGAAPQRFGGGKIPKLCSSGRVRLGLGSRGRMNNSDRKWLIAQNGDRPLDDLASTRLSTGARIILPSVDHALRLCPALRRCRTCPASALASHNRRLRRAFWSLLCHVISPVPESPT